MTLGNDGERLAARFLRHAGFTIVARNYTCPAGEIDIIALDRDTIVFVEVKTRRSDESAYPEANITASKRRQLTRVARYYLHAKAADDRPARFDVVSVVMGTLDKPDIKHFIDAFEATMR